MARDPSLEGRRKEKVLLSDYILISSNQGSLKTIKFARFMNYRPETPAASKSSAFGSSVMEEFSSPGAVISSGASAESRICFLLSFFRFLPAEKQIPHFVRNDELPKPELLPAALANRPLCSTP